MRNEIKNLIIYIVTLVICGSLVVGCNSKSDLNSGGIPDVRRDVKSFNVEVPKETDFIVNEGSEDTEYDLIAGENDINQSSGYEDLDEAIIHIADSKINLVDWKDKTISNIIDELASTGVTFNYIRGTVEKDSSGYSLDKEQVKEAFSNIDKDSYLSIKMGFNENDECIELTYRTEDNKKGELTLTVDMYDDSDAYDIVRIGNEK